MRYCQVIMSQLLNIAPVRFRRGVLSRSLVALVAAATLVVPTGLAAAQIGAPTNASAGTQGATPPAGQTSSSSSASDTVVVSSASPRAALTEFLEAARQGDFGRAARYLDLPPTTTSADSAAVARRLKLVLDHYVWFDLTEVSPAAEGDTTDGLPRGVDRLGYIPRADGGRDAVRMTRASASAAAADEDAPWRFTRATVEHVPAWYGTLGQRWLIDHLPAPLLRSGPLNLLWWQWAALIPLAFVAYIIGLTGSHALRRGFGWMAGRTSTDLDDVMIAQLGGPLTFVAMLVVLVLLLPFLGLNEAARLTVLRVVRAGGAVAFFWAVWRTVDVARQLAARSHWARTAPSSRSLLPLGARTAKAVVAAVAFVAVVSALGYPVTTLIAGLGIGGLALALAAQKTVENLFGAFSIGIDQPFREGDFVRVDDFVGTVEAIGLRSTRFRTLDRTLVSLPNGRLADMRLESYTARDRLRLALVVGLVYETTSVQMREVLTGLERVLRAHPKIWPDAVVVRFAEFAASSLNIEIMAWFQTSEWSEFQLIRQEVLLQFMEVVEAAGSSFAFPTTTVHLETPAPPAPDVAPGSETSHA